MPRTRYKKSKETKPSPKKSEENERNRGKTKPSPKESHVHVFNPSLGSWVSLPGFMGSPLEYVGFAAGFMGLLLGFAARFVGSPLDSPPRFVVFVLISYFVWFLR